MRNNVERVRHADGSIDHRYTVTQEGTGDPRRPWVARFEGERIGGEATQALAWSLARGHVAGRAFATYVST